MLVAAAAGFISLNVSTPWKTEVVLEDNDLYLTLDLYNINIDMT